MKKLFSVTLVCLLCAAMLAGCVTQKVEQEPMSQMVAMGNPWSDWDSLEEAEAAAGFPFELPEVIAGSYRAAAFRTMNNEMIEIIYRDGDLEICVRKQKGEGQDISGDYNQYDTYAEENVNGAAVTYYCNSGNSAVKQLISYKGYSWSVVATDGYRGDPETDLVSAILGQ